MAPVRKALLVLGQQYMRRVDMTATTIAELAGRFGAGDLLWDAATGETYQAGERGFTPKRTTNTKSRIDWSREASLSLLGRCTEAQGRILLCDPDGVGTWCSLHGEIIDTTGPLPVLVPLVGRVDAQAGSSSCVAVLEDDSHLRLCAEIDAVGEDTELRVHFLGPTDASVDVTLRVHDIWPLPNEGAVLAWEDTDEPLVLA
jgi:hypothetical protein